MKKIMPISIVLMLVCTTLAISIHATTDLQQPVPLIEPTASSSRFNITITVYEGEGCACVPLQGVEIFGYALDGDDQVETTTDEDGSAVLPLEYDLTYRMELSLKDYQTVLVDFNVIDEQQFSFHLQEKEDAISRSYSFVEVLWSWIQTHFR